MKFSLALLALHVAAIVAAPLNARNKESAAYNSCGIWDARGVEHKDCSNPNIRSEEDAELIKYGTNGFLDAKREPTATEEDAELIKYGTHGFLDAKREPTPTEEQAAYNSNGIYDAKRELGTRTEEEAAYNSNHIYDAKRAPSPTEEQAAYNSNHIYDA